VPTSAVISIDGSTNDWVDVAPVPVTASCATPPCDGLLPIAVTVVSTGTDEASELFVRFDLSGGGEALRDEPTLRAVVRMAASPMRPATRGIDRLVLQTTTTLYEKNGFATTGPDDIFAAAWTSDGLEAAVADSWLTFQGIAQLAIVIERQTGDTWSAIAMTEPMPVCWAYLDAATERACEVSP